MVGMLGVIRRLAIASTDQTVMFLVGSSHIQAGFGDGTFPVVRQSGATSETNEKHARGWRSYLPRWLPTTLLPAIPPASINDGTNQTNIDCERSYRECQIEPFRERGHLAVIPVRSRSRHRRHRADTRQAQSL